MNIKTAQISEKSIKFVWDKSEGADSYALFWADRDHEGMEFVKRYEGPETECVLNKSTHIPHYVYAESYSNGKLLERSEKLKTSVTYKQAPQLEKLGRGLIAVKTTNGIFLGWRMFLDEVKGHNETGLTGTDYVIYKNGAKLVTVCDSTNYLDEDGKESDKYSVAPVSEGKEGERSPEVSAWADGKNYIEIPMKKPEGGITGDVARSDDGGHNESFGQPYTYSVNDMSIGDIDGDGEFEYFVKWDPSNAHDVSHRGYT